ncbi:MAG: DUF309 domain-containing protein [Candidatus Acidiferrales bacterium]|jgi:predicted metal-dependent hydrolase
MRATNENQPFQRGIAHFNAGEFFEAHEAWEELWLAVPGPEKAFLQGLIQLAAAFHHHGRGNPRGAKSLLVAGLAKLAGFPDNHGGLELAKLRTQAGQWARALEGGEEPAARRLPQIHLHAAGHVAPKKKRGG